MDDFAAKPTTIPFLAAKLRQWLPSGAADEESAPKLALTARLHVAVVCRSAPPRRKPRDHPGGSPMR